MIILYHPPSSANKKPMLPMSLLAVAAVLEEQGRHPYAIVDGNLEPQPLQKLDALIREASLSPRKRGAGGTHPGIVLAVTVMPGPQLADAVPTCRELRRRYPDLTIVWGGYFPTQHPEVCLRAPYVDYVVRGHGEIVFRALLDALADGQAPGGMPGLAYRLADGTIVAGHPAPIPHPDHLPDFPYHQIETARYVRRTFMGQRTLSHHSSYGCPFFCNFCAVVNMVNGRWLPQSAERTAGVVRHLVQTYRLDSIEFFDNNFFVHEARVAEFAERIQDLTIGWWGEARIDTLLRFKDSTWRAMAESGLRMVYLGAESGSDETLKRMDKGGTMSTAKTLEIARVLRRWQIVPEFSFVMGNPPDPTADIRETIAFIRRIKQINPRSEIVMYMYTPVPLAGDLYDNARANGFAFPETLEGFVSAEWQSLEQRRSVRLPWLRRQQNLHEHTRDFERVLNAYYPTATSPNLRPWHRQLLRGLSAWRYHAQFYRFPLELRVMHRLLAYQRPETTGF